MDQLSTTPIRNVDQKVIRQWAVNWWIHRFVNTAAARNYIKRLMSIKPSSKSQIKKQAAYDRRNRKYQLTLELVEVIKDAQYRIEIVPAYPEGEWSRGQIDIWIDAEGVHYAYTSSTETQSHE